MSLTERPCETVDRPLLDLRVTSRSWDARQFISIHLNCRNCRNRRPTNA